MKIPAFPAEDDQVDGWRRAVLTHVLLRAELRDPPDNGEGLADPCLVRTTDLDERGYGRQVLFGVRWRAHRLVYLLWHGEFPAVVRHKCDVLGCISPTHLESGGQRENMADKVKRGRCGDTRPWKLTRDQVVSIKRRLLEGEKPKAISRDYPVTEQMIRHIGWGKCWASVQP